MRTGARRENPAVWWRPSAWPPEALLLAGSWLASRMVVFALVQTHAWNIDTEVTQLYQGWSNQLRSGSFPIGDPMWQYPPAAALVVLAPGLVPGMAYLQAFEVLALVADGAVMAALLCAALRPGRSFAGAYVWMFSLPLMLTLPYIRYDVIVTAVAVLGLLALPRRPRLGGALAGLGAMLKAWPVLTVLGTPRGRGTRQAWTAVVTSCAALAVVLMLGFRGAFDFLNGQEGRGIEIESLGGSVLQFARLFGGRWTVQYRYGSYEFFGPYVPTITTASLALTAAAFAWLLLWRIRAKSWSEATPFDAALTAVLLFTVTSRVISPQYMIWLAGLSAVCLTVKRTTQRPVAALVVLATALTTLDYPFFFNAVLTGTPTGVWIVVLRNGVLAAAALLSCVRLWRDANAGRRAHPGVSVPSQRGSAHDDAVTTA